MEFQLNLATEITCDEFFESMEGLKNETTLDLGGFAVIQAEGHTLIEGANGRYAKIPS